MSGGSVNRVILVGNLGKDPETRSLQDGGKIANLTLATSETWNDRASGERKERTEWHRVAVLNDRVAEAVSRFCKKGSKIHVEGKLQSRKWTDQQGQERYTTEIVVGKFDGQVTFLDGPQGRDDRSSGGAGAQSSGSLDRRGRSPGGPGSDLDDQIPF